MTKGYRWSLFWAFLGAFILYIIITAVIMVPIASLRNPFWNVAAGGIASGIVGSWFVILAAVAYDLILTQPTLTYGPPPYVPGPGSPTMPGSPPGTPPGPQPPAPPIGP